MPQRDSDPPVEELVPETRLWNGGQGIDLQTWICAVGSVEHAIGYGELFWPRFVEYDGCILFDGFREESYRDFLDGTGNRRAVEAVMNHHHLMELFHRPGAEPTAIQLVYLGRLLKEIWEARLRMLFPNKQLIVDFDERERDDLLDYQITVYQDRSEG